MSMHLMAKLGLDGSGFKLGMKEAESISARFARDFTSTMKGAAVGWISGNWLGSKVLEFFDKVLDRSREISRTSDAYDAPIKKMSVLESTARRAGLELQDMANMMSKLETANQDALLNPTGDNAKAFAQMGLTKEMRMSMSGDALIIELIKSFQKRHQASTDLPAMRQLLGRQYGADSKLLGVNLAKAEANALSEETIAGASEARKTVKEAWMKFEDGVIGVLATGINSWERMKNPSGKRPTGMLIAPTADAGGMSDDGETPLGRTIREAAAEQKRAKDTETAHQTLLDKQQEERNRETELEYDLLHRQEAKNARVRDGQTMASVFNKNDLAGFEKQGIFLRGTPTESINFPKQQLDVSKRIEKKMDHILQKLSTEHYAP